jgi:hypothetical protein
VRRTIGCGQRRAGHFSEVEDSAAIATASEAMRELDGCSTEVVMAINSVDSVFQ